jgi:hypothetical protein
MLTDVLGVKVVNLTWKFKIYLRSGLSKGEGVKRVADRCALRQLNKSGFVFHHECLGWIR